LLETILTIYEDLGLKTVKSVINAGGFFSNLGGSRMSPDVIRAMSDASQDLVEMSELGLKAGEIIAEITGAQAAIPTSGAAAGDVLSVAACMVGMDKGKMIRLPNTELLEKNEVIVQRPHFVAYEQMIRLPGAKVVEVGDLSKVEEWEIDSAINSKTAAIFCSGSSESVRRAELPYDDMIRIAKKHEIPIILDAADTLPPAQNLQRWIAMGFDLVIFSGGKAINGPGDTGFVCGRKDLIESCRAQNAPNDFIGRAFKVSKEQLVGLIVAVQNYSRRDHKLEMERWLKMGSFILEQMNTVPHVQVYRVRDERGTRLRVALDEKELGLKAREVIMKLRKGSPYIATDSFRQNLGIITIDVVLLRDGEEVVLVNRLKELLTAAN
jgi:D-glucosaminate-6-phosphate ammonia-lyase